MSLCSGDWLGRGCFDRGSCLGCGCLSGRGCLGGRDRLWVYYLALVVCRIRDSSYIAK